SQRADRGDFRHPRYLAQPPFQRRGDRGSDRGGISARQVRLHSDHGKVHPWDGRNRQELVCDDPRQKKPGRQQGRAYGATDERLGKAHGLVKTLERFEGRERKMSFSPTLCSLCDLSWPLVYWHGLTRWHIRESCGVAPPAELVAKAIH